VKDLHCLRCKTAEKIPAHNASNTTAADCSAAVFLLPDICYLMTKFLLKDCRPAPVFVLHGLLV
jgi:hypothetical protein